ncbi:MAG: glycerol-3-phosphate acyltransferase [Chloroflexota bacterium]|nr:MAG: acyl-phosphate glycerol 3-phosphate acyltransferase [Chloroflexota bacterium]
MSIGNEALQVIVVVLISYLLGSVPTAYLIGRLNRVNIFEIGSGNMGGTNVARALGCGWGIVVFTLDAIKGIAAVLIATQLMDNKTAASIIAAICVIVGHNWSLFASLLTGAIRGGKGAATAFGTALMIAPFQLIAGICLIGALVIALTRYVSLAVLVMLAVSTLWMAVLISQHAIASEYGFYVLAVAAITLWRFRGNIQRLLAGTERRLGERV